MMLKYKYSKELEIAKKNLSDFKERSSVMEGIDILITGDKDFKEVEIELPIIMIIADFEKTYMQ